jgi:hypothetical protein
MTTQSSLTPEKEYLIFCDESDQRGRYYSNFYGGVIVGASRYQQVTQLLNAKKAELHLFGEVKWEKVTARYLPKYLELIQAFFEQVIQGHIRVRIMFRQNAQVPQALNQDQLDMGYFLLYYQFIKHAFGLEYLPSVPAGTGLRLYFDQFPDTSPKIGRFKAYLLNLMNLPEFTQVNIRLSAENIAEVRSHDHVLLQCLDIVLGSMSFRLNDKHKEKIPGSRRRGKRTVAKETLYETILREICKIHPHFNIGVSTSTKGDLTRRLLDPYMHWSFVPRSSQFDSSRTKRDK